MKITGRDDKSITVQKEANVRDSFNTERNFIKIVINNINARGLKKFFCRRKYFRDLKKTVFQQLQGKIEKQKNNRKYIPDVFLETTEAKEQLRQMIEPVLFFKKIVEDLSSIDFNYFNNVYETLGFKPQALDSRILKNFANSNINNIRDNADKLIMYLNTFVKELPNLDDRESLRKTLNTEQYWLAIKEQGTSTRIKWAIDPFIKYLEIIKKRVCIITAPAGQGKTNLICDLTENYLIKKDLPAALFFGNEFNILNQYGIEDIVVQNLFDFKTISFEEFLQDIETLCNENGKTFTFLIDAINENSDIASFSRKIESFVSKLLRYEFIRIVITCRSEYFYERFQNLSDCFEPEKLILIKDVNKLSWDYSFNRDGLPEHLENRLINNYFSYFGVNNSVSGDVRKRLSNDFLLLRIFSEVYGANINTNVPKIPVWVMVKFFWTENSKQLV